MELSPSEDEAKLSRYKEAFRDLLDPVYDKAIDDIEKEFPNLKGDFYLTDYKNAWHKSHTAAVRFFRVPSFVIFTNPDWKNVLLKCKIELISEKIDSSTTSLLSNFRIICCVSSFLTSILDSFLSLYVPLSKGKFHK